MKLCEAVVEMDGGVTRHKGDATDNRVILPYECVGFHKRLDEKVPNVAEY